MRNLVADRLPTDVKIGAGRRKPKGTENDNYNKTNTFKRGYHMDSIIIEVNPKIELMNSILYTSNHSNLIKKSMGFNPMIDYETEYTEIVKEYFYPYKEHEIYSLVERMTINGFFLGRPMELMCSVGEFPSLNRKYEISPLCRQLCGGEENINNLLNSHLLFKP